jgi:UDP-2,3-diacylglucosamine pyrophosphatase LpxH
VGFIKILNPPDLPEIHGKIKTIKYIELNYSIEWEKLDIIPVSCLHIGSNFFNEQQLRGYIKWIAEKENRRAWLLGDIFDAILDGSPGNMHEASCTLKDAKLLAEDILKPIKEQIDIVIPGNHDNRIFNKTTDEIIFDLCKFLGIENKYHFGDYTGVVRFGKQSSNHNKQVVYSFYVSHGTGGAVTQSGKMNRLLGLAEVVKNCDLYIMAHIHDILTCKLEPFTIDSRNGQLKSIKQTFASSSSWLSYGGYALEKKYKPAKTGSPRIRLYGDRKDIHVSI